MPVRLLALFFATCGSYRVAYVEHRAVSPCGAGSCGAEQKRASVRAYTSFIAEAAKQGVDIIVFPEYGITGFSSYPASTWMSGGYTESLPSTTDRRSVPCDAPASFGGAPSLVSLSCAAKQHGVAVVANLMDMADGDREMYTGKLQMRKCNGKKVMPLINPAPSSPTRSP